MFKICLKAFEIPFKSGRGQGQEIPMIQCWIPRAGPFKDMFKALLKAFETPFKVRRGQGPGIPIVPFFDP